MNMWAVGVLVYALTGTLLAAWRYNTLREFVRYAIFTLSLAPFWPIVFALSTIYLVFPDFCEAQIARALSFGRRLLRRPSH